MTMSQSRREFLKRASLLSVTGVAAPFALNLAAINAAAAQSAGDYRALVCLFMHGGNDHVNTVIPYDTASHAEYQRVRAAIAHPRDALAATQLGRVASQGGREFALHPSLTAVKSLWDEGKAAVVANVGPLMAPTTRSEYRANLLPKPPKLFSHNDQTSVWQAYTPLGEGAPYGWGGRIGDVLASQNASSAFTCVSARGQTLWLAGTHVLQYQIGTSGPGSIRGLYERTHGSVAQAEYRGLLARPSVHVMENELALIHNRSVAAGEQLSSALPAANVFATPTPGTGIGRQLNIVARTIHARNSLGMRRQMFFVGLGTFDHHDGLMDGHAARLGEVNGAIAAFWSWVTQMGLESQVTLFTASEFGRTLSSNGRGTDHGWGSHHFVVGGAVRGRTIYGAYPPIAMEHDQAANHGVLIPTLAVDQYAATLARWFGVGDTTMPEVLPNIRNFGQRYIGFMA